MKLWATVYCNNLADWVELQQAHGRNTLQRMGSQAITPVALFSFGKKYMFYEWCQVLRFALLFPFFRESVESGRISEICNERGF